MALNANRELDFFVSRELIELPVDDDVVIHKGALVGRNRATGLVRPLIAGDDFMGVSYRAADNTVAGHTAGGVSVRLHQGIDVVHALSGVAQGDVGRAVYAGDDETLTLSPTGHSRVGRVAAVEGAGLARVRLQPVTEMRGEAESLGVAELADTSATLTLDQMNRVLLMANSAARTLTLPPAASVRAGGWLRVIKTSAAAFAITLDGHAAETIDGAATFGAVDAAYDGVHLICTGTEWIIAARDIA